MIRILRLPLMSALATAIAGPVLAQPQPTQPRDEWHVLRVLSGSEVRGYYGSALVGAHAWTGGVPMFGVSQSGETDGPTRAGKVFFYDDLMNEQPVVIIDSPAEGEMFGWTMSGGGDWNGDGIPDLAVGAPNAPTPTTGAGRVYLYLGGPAFGSMVSGSVASGEDGDGFGEAVHLVNDINGDGLADLIVGAPRSAKGGATAGRVHIWFGRRDGVLPPRQDVEIPLGTTNDLFGSAIATGDLTGDGQADLVIGSPHHNLGNKITGSVFIFRGGPGAAFTKPTRIISGEATQFQDQFGAAAAIIPAAAGPADLVVGAPQVVVDGRQLGKVYVYRGGQSIAVSPATSILGTTEAGRFGQNVFYLGDVNSDGKGDYAVQARDDSGSRGVLYMYHGDLDREFYRFTGEMTADQLGNSVVALGGFAGYPAGAVAIAARWNDATGENAGRVYLLRIE